MISFFIPIRKNSKRVRNKNLKRIGNYKFGLTDIKLRHLIKFKNKIKKDRILKKIKFEFIVSSDDQRIFNIIKRYKWIKFHKRSYQLSTDNSLDQLIQLVPQICKGSSILWTHVTSPFFNEKSYINFIKSFINNKSYKSAFSGNLIKKFIYNSSQKKWISHNIKKRKWPRTQDLDDLFLVNSAAFIASRNVYLNSNDRIDNKPLPISASMKESFDVDDKEDFKLLKKYLYEKKFR